MWEAQLRQCAHIFVFAWHPVEDETADHRDPNQWEFYVAPTDVLPHGQRGTEIAAEAKGPGSEDACTLHSGGRNFGTSLSWRGCAMPDILRALAEVVIIPKHRRRSRSRCLRTRQGEACPELQ